MPNAKDADAPKHHRIMAVGDTGNGKSAQWWSLRGRKFGYIFDPNTLRTIRGLDMDYEEFYPDIAELDATLKGFNKGAKDDKVAGSKREPTTYMKFVEDINAKVETGFFSNYDWIGFDSLTFLTKAIMGRQLYINNRYGSIEELADYRVVGSKLTEVFNSIVSLPINIFATGHIQTFQDEKTLKISTELRLPGQAKGMLPLMFADVWMCHTEEAKEGTRYKVRTRPDRRGLQSIRCSIKELADTEDVTIDFRRPTEGQGIQRLLDKAA